MGGLSISESVNLNWNFMHKSLVFTKCGGSSVGFTGLLLRVVRGEWPDRKVTVTEITTLQQCYTEEHL